LIFNIAFTFNLNAQEGVVQKADSVKFSVIKNNGVEYIGFILSDDGREILLLTENLGKIYILKSEIKNIRKIDAQTEYQGGSYIGTSAFTTRYQFTTNAFPIKRNDHYAATNLYGPEVHFSVADNFSVGIMSTWIASPFILALKYTIETSNKKLNFGLGTLMGSTAFLNQGRGFGGLHWAMATYGDRRNNVTLSAGYGYFNWDFFSRRFFPQGTYAATNLPKGKTLGLETAYKGPLIGLGMTFAVNDKVSFIFDAMFVHANYDGLTQNTNSDFIDDVFYYTYEEPQAFVSLSSSNLIFMPGMRFQKSPNRAFQFTLSGVIGSITREYNQTWSPSSFSDRYSFPVPNCTWFFNF